MRSNNAKTTLLLTALSIAAVVIFPVSVGAYSGNDVPDYQVVSVIIGFASLLTVFLSLSFYIFTKKKRALKIALAALCILVICLVLIYVDESQLSLLLIIAAIIILFVFFLFRDNAYDEEWQRIMDEEDRGALERDDESAL